MAIIPSCITLPIIGISGQGGYAGSSGVTLDQIGISLKKAANSTDDFQSGSEFIQVCEKNAIRKVISDAKIKIGKNFAFTPISDVIVKKWTGLINVCDVHSGTGYFALKITNPCRDNFKKNKLKVIELNVDAGFTTTAYIVDGFSETPIELTFVKGLNRKNINYTFENEVGYFVMKLGAGVIAYINDGCACNDDGRCGCSRSTNVYSGQIVESNDEQCEPLMDYADSDLYDSLVDINNPVFEALGYSILGYEVSSECSYDWLFCQFSDEMVQPALIQIGIQVYEKSKFTERFNPWVEAASDQADYYLRKWLGGNDAFGTFRIGEYDQQINLLVESMLAYIRKGNSTCLPCNGLLTIVEVLP